MAARGFGLGVAFATYIILARLMGSSGYGVFIYLLTWLSFSSMLGRMGLDQAMIRFVPSALALDDRPLLRGLLARSLLVVLLGGSLVALASPALLQGLVPEIARSLRGYFPWIFVAVPMLAANLWRGVLRGLKRTTAAEFLDSGLRPLVLALAAAGSWLLWRSLAAGLALAAISLFALLAVLTARHIALPIVPPLPGHARHQTRKWLDAWMWMLFAGAMHMILSQGALFLVGHYLGVESAGVYGASSRLAMLAHLGQGAVTTVVAPVIAEVHVTRRHDRLRDVLALAATGIFALSVLMLVTLGTWSGEVLGLYGIEFEPGADAQRILLAGQAVAAFFIPAGYLLGMTGHHRTVGIVALASALANLALSALLVPRYGLAGAAGATSLALLTSRSTMAYQARRVPDTRSTVRWRRSFSPFKQPSRDLSKPKRERDDTV